MSFKEANRHVSHDKKVHINSVAYEKVQNFLRRRQQLEVAHEDLEQLKRGMSLVQELNKAAQEEMLAALQDHYDGNVPECINFSGDVIFIKPALDDEEAIVRVIRPESYSDLYRIEVLKTAAPAADEA